MIIKISLPGIRITIGRKLLIGILAMLLLIAVISLKGIRGIYRIGNASIEMLHKSLVHNSIQQIKITIQQLIMPANDYLIHGNRIEFKNFENLLTDIKTQMNELREIVENNSEQKILNDFVYCQKEVHTLSQKIFNLDNPIGNNEGAVIMERMDSLTDILIIEIDKSVITAEKDMHQYIKMNNKIFDDSVKSIIILGLFIAFCMLVGGFIYANEITKSIKHLAQTARKVSQGDFSAKVSIKTNDEIENFAKSFNTMLGVLEKTTVSREYFNNILNRMVDSLIITDANDSIKVVNQATLKLLGYTEKEIIGKPMAIVLSNETLKENPVYNDVQKQVKRKEHVDNVDNVYNTYYSKDGKAIPVSFSSSLMYKNDSTLSGMICIAHYNSGNNEEEMLTQQENEGRGPQYIKAGGEIPLTDRELEIIKLIAEEFSNREIADKLFISVRTVETHRRNIMQKLHTKSVISLVHYAILNDII